MERRKERPKDRVYGPYQHYGKWRVILYRSGGGRTFEDHETEDEALRAIRGLKRAISRESGVNVAEALDRYEVWLRTEKRNKPRTVATTMDRLRTFFEAEGQTQVPALTKRAGEELYRAYQKGRAVDTHRNTLNQGKTFLRWCVKQGWVSASPIAEVEGLGRRRKGKPQLRIDEARRWLARAAEVADAGDRTAVAAMMTLLMGMRASEVAKRKVRDLDDGGRLLWIEDAKTEAGSRRLRVPEVLQPYLSGLVKGRGPEEPLFGAEFERHRVRRTVRRLCMEAGVPMVGAHSMRGLHATLAVDSGTTSHAVAAALGHASFAVTAAHYAKPEAIEGARSRKVEETLRAPDSVVAVKNHSKTFTATDPRRDCPS